LKKRVIAYVLMISLSILSIGKIGIKGVKAEEAQYWGLIVQGWECHGNDFEFEGDSQYMYHLMNEHFDFDGIHYLSINNTLPGVTNETTEQNLNWSITEWLGSVSDSNDVIVIWFATHGGGYDSMKNYTDDIGAQNGLRQWNDTNGDEGNETSESTLGFDFNNDSDTDDWIGIDEYIWLQSNLSDSEKWISDDELNAILSNLSYDKLIIGISSCFGGGLVDDLSATNRIIMTSSNETDEASLKHEDDNMSPWGSNFMDALHGEHMEWKIPGWKLVHTGIKVEADANNDGNISLLEAWNYAWNNTSQRIDGTDTYWLDDNGNGLPTYWNETDNWTGWPSSIPCDNGTLAGSTWFPKKYGWFLTVETSLVSGQEINGVDIWVDGSLAGNSSLTLNVTVGSHKIKAEHSITYQGYNYYLSYWNDTLDPNGNPTTAHLHENKTIKACYDRTVYMQNAKWDGTYWKLYWNNTATYTSRQRTQSAMAYGGYLGVKIFKVNDTETLLIDDETNDILTVGCWLNEESGIKSKNWTCSEQNVTNSYIKVEIYYKFSSGSWAKLDVNFRTENFTDNTILNATAWNISLWGCYTYLLGPRGPGRPPGSSKATIAFHWGSTSRESCIEDMIFTSG